MNLKIFFLFLIFVSPFVQAEDLDFSGYNAGMSLGFVERDNSHYYFKVKDQDYYLPRSVYAYVGPISKTLGKQRTFQFKVTLKDAVDVGDSKVEPLPGKYFGYLFKTKIKDVQLLTSYKRDDEVAFEITLVSNERSLKRLYQDVVEHHDLGFILDKTVYLGAWGMEQFDYHFTIAKPQITCKPMILKKAKCEHFPDVTYFDSFPCDAPAEDLVMIDSSDYDQSTSLMVSLIVERDPCLTKESARAALPFIKKLILSEYSLNRLPERGSFSTTIYKKIPLVIEKVYTERFP